MKYRLTVLTPTLVGDGQKLSPIDYMVWKDQVNVLDQRRIFRLLAKGPRLEGYLAQLRKAEKLDFASWGGFAQNFAGRRIPFEHSSMTKYWEQARAEHLHIPTFCAGPAGAYLPGSALKGALRTGLVAQRWSAGVIHQIAERMKSDRPPRKPGEAAETMALGHSGADPLKGFALADSAPVAVSHFKVYLLRIATLEQRGNALDLAWKQAPRGLAGRDRTEQSVPLFSEMASPGVHFTGALRESRAPRSVDTADLLQAANRHAADLLRVHKSYAERTNLPRLKQGVEALEQRLEEARRTRNSALVNLGWGGGLLGKAGFSDTENEDYRRILAELPYYSRAIRSGMPFPKTRKIIFLENQPATLPGWTLFEVEPALH